MVNYLQLVRESLVPLSSGDDSLTDQNNILIEARIHLAAHSYRNRQGRWPKDAKFPTLLRPW